MNSLRFSENLIQLRRKRKVTQEQLANFLGVTKASVSKWETRQSLPDILLLPRLAAFFDVTVDELIGYEPQLSKEQIQKIYGELAAEFAQKSFEEAFAGSQDWMRRYYSCYPFLYHLCILWLNHFMLAETRERQMEVLYMTVELCEHILDNCRDRGLGSDTEMVKAMVDLQLGMVEDAVEILEEQVNPLRVSAQSDGLLIQAYQMAGRVQEADSFTQISMYTHLLSLIAGAGSYLSLHGDNLSLCQETVSRIDRVMEIYQVETLHPNVALNFRYQEAICYCIHGKKGEALAALGKCVTILEYFLTEERFASHNDSYFDHIDDWFEKTGLGLQMPRDLRVVQKSAKEILGHPAMEVLKEEPEFIKLRERLHTD